MIHIHYNASPLLLLAAALTACGYDGSGATDSAAGTMSATTDSTATATGSTGETAPTTGTQPGTDSAASSSSTDTSDTAPTTDALTSTTSTGDPGTTADDSTTTSSSTTTTSTGTTSGDTTTTAGSTDSTGTTGTTGDDTTTGGNGLWDSPNLWYSVDDALMYIELDPMDGSVVKLVHNQLVPDVQLYHGQNGLTMLEDGSLLGSRESANGTQIFHVPDPPTMENTPAAAIFLGVVPNDNPGPPLRIEALYTDCDGRVYLMDTGVDVSSAEGNRLLRFTGEYLQGQLDFEVITDLQNASVADIDDMSPGIVDGEVSDSLGFAMDSTYLWQIDYTTGTGMQLAQTDGTWGVHALGAPLFADATPRLYILSAGDANTGAELFQVDLNDYSNTPPLIIGPDLDLPTGYNGWSGLAGPLTECMTTIPQ